MVDKSNPGAHPTRTRRFHPGWIVLVVVATLVVAGLIWLPASVVSKTDQAAETQLRNEEAAKSRPPAEATGESSQAIESPAEGQAAPATVAVKFTPPDPDSIPAGEMGDMIRLGQNIFNDTQSYARGYVGNKLNCVNCHLDSGRKADSAPLWASYGMYPAYRDKNKKVNSYVDRLSGCFQFSMNGKAPAPDSKEMLALVSYSAWLATGAPVGLELEGRGYLALDKPAQSPDKLRGQKVYEANCAICHGADGNGTQVAGRTVFPPLWGPQSFNGGAGMSKIHNAAGFIKENMPLGQGGSLSLQDAWDVAEFMNSHERPADPRKKGK